MGALAGRSSGRRVSAASRGGSGCERLELGICRYRVRVSGRTRDKPMYRLPTWVYKLRVRKKVEVERE